MARPRPPRASERGAALLLAVVSVAILTALAVDLAYETQVRLRTAAHARDALRAEGLARSGVTLARLMVSLQQQVDTVSKVACNTQASGAAQPTAACLRIQVWNMVSVSSSFATSLFGDAGAAPSPPAAAPAGGEGAAAVAKVRWGDFDGGFETRIEDESSKINVQLDDLEKSGAGTLGPKVEALLGLVCDSKWDPLFSRSDFSGQRYSRTDLLVHLRDWVDDDTNASGLHASFPGGNCSFEVLNPAFQKGFSDENFPYDRGTDRYKAKNHRFDSVEELHLVAGVTDAFMAAFGDQFTVYVPREAGRNVNTDVPREQFENARLAADRASEVVFRDPEFLGRLRKEMLEARMGGLVSITPVQFALVLQQRLGVNVRPQFLTQGPDNPFTDSTLVYRIRSSAVAGDVTHTTDAVVSYDPRLLPEHEKLKPGQKVNMNPPLGRLIRWREE